MSDPRPLVIYQGVELDAQFVVTTSDGQPFPLSGYKAAMQIRPRPGSDELLLDLSSDAGTLIIEPDGDVGVIQCSAGADLTVMVTRGGKYDCLAWPAASPTAVVLIARGDAKLEQRVTQKP